MKMQIMGTTKALAPEEIRHMRALVVGLARSGLAACRVLREMGVPVKATDMRPADGMGQEIRSLGDVGVELELGRNSIEFARDCDLVIVSPGVPLDIPVIRWAYGEGKTVMGEVELAFCLSDARFVAVTGTNGKSTTVSLLGDIVRGATDKVRVGGNIGDPISALVKGLGEDWTAVIEVSSFQLDTSISFRPRVGVLLNITPDHLNRYSSYDAYVASKARLFANQTAEDVAVLNFDDPDSIRAAEDAPSHKVFFSLKQEVAEGTFVRDGHVVVRVGGRESEVFLASDLRIRGPHNLANSLAAALAATALGIDPDVIKRAIRGFTGLEHRLEHVDKIGGIEFINDSKATNIDALRNALEAARGRVVLIAGGRDKGGDWCEISGPVGRAVKSILAIGEARKKIREAFSGLVEVETAESLDEAVRRAFLKASSGESVLLSPGCASFDMFTDFEHRGREFKRAVRQLKMEHESRGNG
jgi:UDP-N-acetylmuramoylalanine--D-glutamate ligase